MSSSPFVFSLVLASLAALISARAVNISNTWMLPEEGFPVFYHYFRDRISWYEADAVCQFHHANLVTADSSSQFDAIRAYLKELDIADDVWLGLSKTAERPRFSWMDFRPLSGEGHWQEAIPSGNNPLCVSMDPSRDFLWKAMSCGGPEVASFICELPVPEWAMGPRGCLLTELPSLTVLYIPEQLAVELTSDCGLDGTKRIACKGNADREEILKQLTCAISPDDFDEGSTKEDTKTTKPWLWTSNTIDGDYGTPTRHRRETEDTLSPKSTTDLSAEITKRSTTEMSNSNYDTEVTTISTMEDVTLDSSVSGRSDKPEDVEEGGASTTIESKSDSEDGAEYPSAISQGQLFSIIENGTMFDIIELNETTTDEMKTPEHADLPKTPTEMMSTSTTTISDIYTTVVYHKEPPSEPNFVTNKSVKTPKKVISKEKDPKKFDARKPPKKEDKSLNKEIDLFPILTDSNVKLNRTNRKLLPMNEEEVEKESNSTTIWKEAKEGEKTAASVTGAEFLQPEPQPQPRPNRQRQLTRPQRRSFYPYFFSRVLG